ncbi:hypothetical protein N9R81_03025, partial [Flavobacteriales bacterium]|nr:hypothetical protein [Flavobacteriales bacterium]
AGATYAWGYSGSGWSCATNCTTNAITANYNGSATSGTLSVTPTNACGTGTARTQAITVNTAPSAPTAATHTPDQTQIAWDWNAVGGATGYKWNITNNYATATNVGGSTAYTQTGLTCNTAYTLYVWAYDSCGESGVLTLTESTGACYNGCFDGTTAIVDVTNGSTGETWMDRNLGASRAATSSTDAAGYGDLYQWGRCPEGHEIRTSSTTSTNATTAVPSLGNPWDGKFITSGSSPYDWLTPQDNTLWQGVSGTNNPCPSGYRLPTYAELNAERLSWGSNNAAGAYSSPLKLPLAGNRNRIGNLGSAGSIGFYWSNTISGADAGGLNFIGSSAGMVAMYYRATGMSVRCIRD